ncbi:MAG: D-alanyl-D-alanine carboxypeptidase/D-alanyl-D-alanine-endopeptidase [Acidimicrobiales bacterium]
MGVGILVLGVVAGGLVAWRSEAGRGDARAAGRALPRVETPLLSVRRAPTIVAAPVARRRLVADLDRLTGALPADTCLAVSGPDVDFAHRADAALRPASTLKLLTATAALDHLDPRSRFRTTVAAPSRPDGAGVVQGDLTLVGGGDPLLATGDYVGHLRHQPQVFTDLDALASAVVDAGVRRVTGGVVGDEGRYDQLRYVAGWPSRYIDQGSIGPLSALSVNDGFATYPTRDEPGRALAAAPQPAQEAAAVFTRLLRAHGVEVGGEARAGSLPFGAVELAGVESPPLVEVVGEMVRESDNNTAELLLKEIGRGEGSATTAGGAAVVAALGEQLGAGKVVDGSGLSLDDRLTCATLLAALVRADTGDVLADLLPVAAESGTLTERFHGTALQGVLRAKTGSLSSVSALAGFVDDDDPPLAFALVVNAPASGFPSNVDDLEQQIAEALARWPDIPDAADVGPRVDDG